jgi:hypothetical protein
MLFDERFSQASSINQLPGWLKQHVRKVNDFKEVTSGLGSFFNVAIEKVL